MCSDFSFKEVVIVIMYFTEKEQEKEENNDNNMVEENRVNDAGDVDGDGDVDDVRRLLIRVGILSLCSELT
jgi:hypothetical protein